jgi:hypothetical protein
VRSGVGSGEFAREMGGCVQCSFGPMTMWMGWRSRRLEIVTIVMKELESVRLRDRSRRVTQPQWYWEMV